MMIHDEATILSSLPPNDEERRQEDTRKMVVTHALHLDARFDRCFEPELSS
jgi:hypothetical protein